MNNIWKYSLVLAFSIIVDQLIKGTAQTLILEPSSAMNLFGPLLFVRAENHSALLGIDISFLGAYQNLVCHFVDLLIIIWIIKRIIFFRNRSPILGWAYTFWLMGVFTSWLDRVSLGYTLDYLRLSNWDFSMGDIYTAFGLMMMITLEILRKRVKGL